LPPGSEPSCKTLQIIPDKKLAVEDTRICKFLRKVKSIGKDFGDSV
jgi:hypothetical protein